VRKVSFRDRVRYAFDNYMGKGTIALIFMLFLITAIVVCITGILSSFGKSDSTVGNLIWFSLMHALDAGTLAGDDTSKIGFLILMSIVTICGIFVTSILIGIISTGFEEKLNALRKGFSRVIEENHTVIIGFNDSIYTMLTELIEANVNQKRGCILVIGEEEKEFMDAEIRTHIKDFKTTQIICRSGRSTNASILEMASVETARSIIICEEDDFAVIKALLSVVSYMKEKNVFENDTHIVSLIHERENLDAAVIAGEGKAEIIFFKDIIARVIANTCRQPGLSAALVEMFGFDGDEFYFEEFPELVGNKFADILNKFEKSVVVGLYKNNKPMLNPPMDTIIEHGDKVIHLAEDDGASKPMKEAIKTDIIAKLSLDKNEMEEKYNILILGHNDMLELIVRELNDFLPTGSNVVIACESIPKEAKELWKVDHFDISFVEENVYDKNVLEKLVTEEVKNILLLSDDEEGTVDADSRILLLLLQIRSICSSNKWNINITSEMNSVENQKLMQNAKVNDFVVGSAITCLIMTQIAENRHLNDFFTTLLTAEGSELYMKEATNYVKPNIQTNIYELTDIAKKRGEIVMGYKKNVNQKMMIAINPNKLAEVSFEKGDCLIVLAEN